MNATIQIVRAIAIAGLLAAGATQNVARGNHYILPCAPDCRGQYDIPIGPAMTGNWFNADQAGQGFSIQVLPGQPLRLLATWFVFAPSGGLSWITGQGPIAGTQAVVQGYRMTGTGGRFPPEFDNARVQTEYWGTLTFTFSGCDHGRVTWASTAPGYGSGSMNLTRLTMPAGLACPADDAGELK